MDLRPSFGASVGWVDLGEYYFSGVGNEFVRLTRSTSTTSTILTRADAVKFEGNIQQKSLIRRSSLMMEASRLMMSSPLM